MSPFLIQISPERRWFQVNTLKDQGNKAFAAKDYDKAVDLFTQAIALDPKNHVLWSNRSAARTSKKEWEAALSDAEEVIPVTYLICPMTLFLYSVSK
jgi:tetratricopeptide (TPR) repeat protein